MSATSPSGPVDDAPESRLVAGASAIVGKVNELAGAEDNAANRVAPDTSRTFAWVGVLFALCSVALVPWTVYVALSLPSRSLSRHDDLAWAGFDVMLFVALATVAVTVLRRSRWAATAAGASAALLVTDAWFDVVTAPSRSAMLESLALAVVVELPLAGVCLWTARHATDITEERISVLLRRRQQA